MKKTSKILWTWKLGWNENFNQIIYWQKAQFVQRKLRNRNILCDISQGRLQSTSDVISKLRKWWKLWKWLASFDNSSFQQWWSCSQRAFPEIMRNNYSSMMTWNKPTMNAMAKWSSEIIYWQWLENWQFCLTCALKKIVVFDIVGISFETI